MPCFYLPDHPQKLRTSELLLTAPQASGKLPGSWLPIANHTAKGGQEDRRTKPEEVIQRLDFLQRVG